jgi:hypothetical protein
LASAHSQAIFHQGQLAGFFVSGGIKPLIKAALPDVSSSKIRTSLSKVAYPHRAAWLDAVGSFAEQPDYLLGVALPVFRVGHGLEQFALQWPPLHVAQAEVPHGHRQQELVHLVIACAGFIFRSRHWSSVESQLDQEFHRELWPNFCSIPYTLTPHI